MLGVTAACVKQGEENLARPDPAQCALLSDILSLKPNLFIQNPTEE